MEFLNCDDRFLEGEVQMAHLVEDDGDFVDPTPKEILLRRAEIHRAGGDIDMAQWLELEAALDQDESAECDAFAMTLFEFGLDESFCELMLDQGVWDVGQLVEWRAGMLLRLPGMNRKKLRRVDANLRRYGLRLRRGRRREEKWRVDAGSPAAPPAELCYPDDEGISPFTKRKIIELWELGVPQREITNRFDLGRNSHYQVWTIIHAQQRLRTAAALRQHLGRPNWVVDVTSETVPDSSQWELVVRVAAGERDRLRGFKVWRSRPVRVEEEGRKEGTQGSGEEGI
ncbi:MAG TPA: hypothetical protein VGX76_00830 [Pirellulales bacterium]|jgi:hypothetical protein|nr:hypothetical protein [Pirellulales bacterium]